MKEFERLLGELDSCHCGAQACDCTEVLENLFELLDEEIPVEKAHRLLLHGQECPECAQRIEAELRLRKAIQRSCCSAVAPASLRVRIRQTVIKYSSS
ncbi:MAG: mycothiol system anti-sigma-R factor [Actinomycetaceae bacterium]|nr:mycothiol system anti-sigma-R factor [Actinomycetaceae bacterium]